MPVGWDRRIGQLNGMSPTRPRLTQSPAETRGTYTRSSRESRYLRIAEAIVSHVRRFSSQISTKLDQDWKIKATHENRTVNKGADFVYFKQMQRFAPIKLYSSF